MWLRYIPHPSREELRTTGDDDRRKQTRTKMATPERHEATEEQRVVIRRVLDDRPIKGHIYKENAIYNING